MPHDGEHNPRPGRMAKAVRRRSDRRDARARRRHATGLERAEQRSRRENRGPTGYGIGQTEDSEAQASASHRDGLSAPHVYVHHVCNIPRASAHPPTPVPLLKHPHYPNPPTRGNGTRRRDTGYIRVGREWISTRPLMGPHRRDRTAATLGDPPGPTRATTRPSAVDDKSSRAAPVTLTRTPWRASVP